MSHVRHSEETITLLPSQRRTWNAQAPDLKNPVFKIADFLRIDGPVDPSLMQTAYEQVVAETEALRLAIVTVDGEHRQYLTADPEPFRCVDLRAEPDPAAAADAWMAADLAAAVDPRRLCGAALLRTADDRCLLYWCVHHAVLDGWSLALLFDRLAEVYTARAAGRAADGGRLPPLGLLIEAEDAYRGSKRFAADRSHWLAKLADRPEPATLGGSRTGGIPAGHRRRAELGRERAARMGQAADRLGVSWSDVAIGTVAAYVARMTGAEEVILGMPTATRLSPELRKVPGMVTNGVPLRIPAAPTTPLIEHLRQVSREVREALLHGRYPTAELSRELGLPAAGRPLWGPIVNVMTFPYRLDFAGSPATVHTTSVPMSPDVTFYFFQTSADRDMEVVVDAHPELHSAQDVEGHLERLLSLLDTVATAAPELPLGELPLVGEAERERLLAWGTGPVRPLAAATVHGLFEKWAASTPDAPALEFPDGAVSFAELEARAERLAGLLRARGAGPGQRVAFALSRTADRYAVPLAVLKTGAAFVPVDPAYPLPRIAYMMADANPLTVVLDASTAHLATGLDIDSVVLGEDATEHEIDAPPGGALPKAGQPGPEDSNPPAYVIYTSGSTGTPKGVLVGHRGVVNLVAAYVDRLDAGPGTRTLHSASAGFDAFVGEMTQSFLNGGTLVVPGPDRLDPGPELARAVARHRINDLVLPPSALAVMDPQEWPPDTTITVVGEACPPSVVEQWGGVCRLINGYGPTEATVSTTMSGVLSADDGGGPAPIGTPLRNVRVHVLDEAGGLVPAGVPGELHIGGVGVALGYLGQPELTGARFVDDPFTPGGRLYRTGDLVRWTSAGQLVFVGRTDDQVQLRGFRIELGEVEAALARCPEVAQAAAAVRTDEAGERWLVGYAVPVAGTAPDPEALRRALGAELPAHLVPGVVAVVDALPLNAHGKLDRAALPAPEPAPPVPDALPRTPVEEVVAALFAETLGLPLVGLEDSFLALGGHSLLATRLLGRIRRTLGVEVAVSEFFAAPTVSAVAAKLAADHRLPSTDHPGLVPLRAQGTKGPVLCVPPPGQQSWSALRLSGRLPRSLPLYGLHTEAGTPEDAARLAAAVRAVRPEGPYRLLGWGAGSAFALAVAVQLQAAGEPVDLLVAPGPAAVDAPTTDRFKGDLVVLVPPGTAPQDAAGPWRGHVTGLVGTRPCPGVDADPFQPSALAVVATALTAELPTHQVGRTAETAEM